MNQTVKELHEKRSKMWEASIENHKKYLNLETGTFLIKYVEKRNCPVCNSKNELEMFYKEGGRYVKCQECDMVYLNPVFKDSTLIEYYQNNHTVQSEIVDTDEDEFYVNLYNKGLEGIIDAAPGASSLLDIGCSSATFLDLAKSKGLKTYGVELNKSEFEFANKKGHRVYNDLLENINFDTTFDAITLWDVFEHIKDGESYLKQIKDILSKNGVIFLQIPSSDSLATKIMREKCNMFDGLEHVNLYGVETIKRLATKCGLEVLSIQTVITEIGVLNNYLSYEDPYFGNTTNKEHLFSLMDEELIHKKLLGYKLQVILGVKNEVL